jgi:hypothetical protein
MNLIFDEVGRGFIKKEYLYNKGPISNTQYLLNGSRLYG